MRTILFHGWTQSSFTHLEVSLVPWTCLSSLRRSGTRRLSQQRGSPHSPVPKMCPSGRNATHPNVTECDGSFF
jgi:hypothetical protein